MSSSDVSLSSSMKARRTPFRLCLPVRIAFVALPVVLGGCSTLSHVATDFVDTFSAAAHGVQEPDAKQAHALMRVSTDGFTWVLPGQTCSALANERGGIAVSANPIYVGARGVAHQIRGVTGDAPKDLTSGELRLWADEPYVLRYAVRWGEGSKAYSCNAARSFVPVAGAHYQMLSFADQPSRRCGLMVLQLSPNPGPVETENAPDCPKR